MRFVVVALVALRSVIVPDADVRSEMVVVARVDTPLTVSVPLEVRDEVATILPPVINPEVRVSTSPVTARKTLANRFVAVAFVRVAFVTPKLVEVALIEVRVAMDPVVEVRLVIVPATIQFCHGRHDKDCAGGIDQERTELPGQANILIR